MGRFNPDLVAPSEALAVRRELGIPPDALVVGFVGRLVRDKGVAELVRAWERIRDEFPGAHLVCVGPIEPRDPISPADRRALEGDPRIHLLGFRQDLPRLYSSMNLLVLPSYREGFPNVPLEAQSMRIPVITTSAEGCVDAVEHGLTGLLVEPRNSDALLRATQAYLRDAGLREQHGRAGRERVLALFARERLWEALLGVYESMLTAARAEPAPSRRALRGSA
jgi:glycosyltransferase involved in cell wall biosynthesis